MLAILYLAVMIYFGDRISRRFYRFASIQQRIATAFLIGLLASTVITYLGSLAFARLSQPLIAGNLIFLAISAAFVYKLWSRNAPVSYEKGRWNKWDWIWLALSSLLACSLIFTTLGFKDGSFQIPFKAWTDFGANISLTQSFVLGHNFPTEHPFFPGEMLRYHFLFWFQAANLEFLGLNAVWAVNLLSVLSFIALLILITTLGELLFKSAAAGRTAGLLFFFSTSLSYIPFLRSQPDVRAALHEIFTRTDFLKSGYPYRGEDWGVLTVDVFANQRHLMSAVALFLVVLIFLISRSAGRVNEGSACVATIDEGDLVDDHESGRDARGPNHHGARDVLKDQSSWKVRGPEIAPYIFSGLVIGGLPYWNSAIFVAAMVVIASMIVLLPRRLYLLTAFITALVIGAPQVWLLRRGVIKPPDQHFLTWGYTLQNPSFLTVVKYLGWTFGLKWLLIVICLLAVSNFHRRLFLALSSLIPVVFLFQLSTDIFNNHKLLNVWSIFGGIYAAYGLCRIVRVKIVGVVLAAVLAVATVAEGVINLFPVHNDAMLVLPYRGDRLTNWVLQNSNPTDIFLTQTVLTHPILFAGRRVYLGYTLFAWTAGYNVGAREQIYRRMFEERDPVELANLLRQNRIAYVGIDDGVRNNQMIHALNEGVFAEHFQKVFEDTERRYDNIVIYKVP